MKKRPASKLRKRSSTVGTPSSSARIEIVVNEKAIRKRVLELAKQLAWITE